MVTFDDLKQYQVNPKTGFVPAADPLTRLPSYYQPWEQIVGQMEDLLMSGQFCAFIGRLPQHSLDQLEDERAKQRAMLLLSVMGNAYVWGGPEPAKILPAQIAGPWCRLADYLGRPPNAAHESMVLNNWRRIDPDRPLSLDNVATLARFWGGLDESSKTPSPGC